MERDALDYPLGRSIFERFSRERDKEKTVELKIVEKHNTVRGLPGDTPRERFFAAKQTLVVGVRRTLKLAGCRPSADYQLPLSSSCPGLCSYCYLHTTLGKTPAPRLYVNLDEILQTAANYMKQRLPEQTIFEGSATSDPLALEHLSGALRRTITFFAGQKSGRFRFVTKQTNVNSLLWLKHCGNTRIRFSINVPEVVQKYERGVPPVKERIMAALSVRQAGYPVGFMIAPIFVFPGWLERYRELVHTLHRCWTEHAEKNDFPRLDGSDPSFELITHRFTARAKKNIMELFPENTLPLAEAERRYKYGQFGYGKYIYDRPVFAEINEQLAPLIKQLFAGGSLDYLV